MRFTEEREGGDADRGERITGALGNEEPMYRSNVWFITFM